MAGRSHHERDFGASVGGMSGGGIRATLMLCDYAVVAEGKLFISGGGWGVTLPGAPSAIALVLGVPWNQANTKISFELALLAEDGERVLDAQAKAVEIAGEFEVGRPPGLKPGIPLEVPMAFTVAPIALEPGKRFDWVLTVNGETQEDWHLGFGTRPALATPREVPQS